MLVQLLQFVDNMSIDEKLYWRVNGKAPGEVFEVSWNRNAKPKSWRIKKMGAEQEMFFNTSEADLALTAMGVDIMDIERQLGVSVLTQAVFADMVLNGARQLFGAEVVERSVEDTKAFLNAVSQMARSHAGGPAAASEAVKSQETTARKKSHLRLVADKLH